MARTVTISCRGIVFDTMLINMHEACDEGHGHTPQCATPHFEFVQCIED